MVASSIDGQLLDVGTYDNDVPMEIGDDANPSVASSTLLIVMSNNNL